MAVYTHLGAEDLAAIIATFDVGALVSAKGIAEGVSNSNWLIETQGAQGQGARFILTVYENRTEPGDLPFFLGLLDHLAARGCPVPRTIHDRQGRSFQMPDGVLDGKALALIEFLPGVSVSRPTAAQARAVGAALAQVHNAAADFAPTRVNTMAMADWQALFAACGDAALARIDPALPALVAHQMADLAARWPTDLPRSVVHADLFPDNVLICADRVSGMIDFYFACNDITAYDVAVTFVAWSFSADGRTFHPEIGQALLAGYDGVRALSAAERAALPVLARGAAMRFLATRAFDWINTPADALVVRKDPLAFARRLEFLADPANAALFDSQP